MDPIHIGIAADYDFSKEIETSKFDLLGIEQQG